MCDVGAVFRRSGTNNREIKNPYRFYLCFKPETYDEEKEKQNSNATARLDSEFFSSVSFWPRKNPV